MAALDHLHRVAVVMERHCIHSAISKTNSRRSFEWRWRGSEVGAGTKDRGLNNFPLLLPADCQIRRFMAWIWQSRPSEMSKLFNSHQVAGRMASCTTFDVAL